MRIQDLEFKDEYYNKKESEFLFHVLKDGNVPLFVNKEYQIASDCLDAMAFLPQMNSESQAIISKKRKELKYNIHFTVGHGEQALFFPSNKPTEEKSFMYLNSMDFEEGDTVKVTAQEPTEFLESLLITYDCVDYPQGENSTKYAISDFRDSALKIVGSAEDYDEIPTLIFNYKNIESRL